MSKAFFEVYDGGIYLHQVGTHLYLIGFPSCFDNIVFVPSLRLPMSRAGEGIALRRQCNFASCVPICRRGCCSSDSIASLIFPW